MITLKTKISDTKLPTRIKNALEYGRCGFMSSKILRIKTIGEIYKYKQRDIMRLSDFGETSLNILKRFLEDNGMEPLEDICIRCGSKLT